MKRRSLLQGLAATTATWSCRPTTSADVGGAVVDDVSRLNECRVRRVVRCQSIDDVVAAVLRAQRDHIPLIASGSRHSQGGQCLVDDGVVLDLTPLRKIIGIDDVARTVTVQGGATWNDVQHALNPRGWALRTMQSSNLFTVGGSCSSNIHGDDINDSVLFSVVRSLTLVDAQGRVRVLVPGDPLLPLVVGGFGLFGVVVEATLSVTPNTMMQARARVLKAVDIPAFFAAEVAGSDCLFRAQLCPAPSSFLDEAVVQTCTAINDVVDAALPRGDQAPSTRDRLIFDGSRRSAAGKESRWIIERTSALASTSKHTRNQAMRAQPFFAHDDEGDTDLLQEYFVPVAGYGEFLAAAQVALVLEKTKLLGMTIRFVRKNNGAMLSYAPVDSFSFMIHSNHQRTAAGIQIAARTTQRLVDAVMGVGGRHYLTYQTWATQEQMLKTWPRLPDFLALKRAADPAEVFQSRFYRFCANS